MSVRKSNGQELYWSLGGAANIK